MRKCKCYYCKEWILSEEDKVRFKITEKQEKNFHIECKVKFEKEKTKKDIEYKKWTELYEYVKKEIMGYTKEKQLTPNMRTKLQSLRNGSFVRKGVSMNNQGYEYNVILTTFKAKKVEIENATFGKVFEDDNHKFNYIMIIITNSINDVANRIENARKLEEREEIVTELIHVKDTKETYEEFKKIQQKKQKKNNKVASMLSDLL